MEGGKRERGKVSFLVVFKMSIYHLITVLMTSLVVSGAPAEQFVTARDLLAPEMFPDASFGMAVEAVEDGAEARVTTTGGVFRLRKEFDEIEYDQRIPAPRQVATLKFPVGSLRGIELTHHSSGAVVFEGAGTTVRINGDSTLMIAPGQHGHIKAELSFPPDCHFGAGGNHNFFDPNGGVSFFDNGHSPEPHLDLESAPITVTWDWRAGAVFWSVVSPPKPFDWDASFRHYAGQGSSHQRYVYPSDGEIEAASKHASVLFLHSEMLLWKAWQTNLTPRAPKKLERVIKTAHHHGMKVIVYTTPVWFLKNTPREDQQQIDPTPGPMGTVPHWGRPDNANLFFQQISRVFREMSLDGFYFDGIYGAPEHLAASYHLTRATRELVGDDGVLIYHGTGDTPSIGGSRTYCPSLNAYYDYILRGEGEEKRTDPQYVRYFLSSYNLSNSVCLSLYKTDEIPSAEQIDLTLRANVRYPMPLGLLVGDSPNRAHFQEHYFSRLTPSLQAEIAGDLARRTGALERKLARARALRQRLAEERDLGKHLKPEDFDMPLRGGYWRFEEPYGLRVFDSSVPRINGIFDGGVARAKTTPALSVPRLGLGNQRSMEFDGVKGSHVRIGREEDLNVGTEDFTLEAWIYPRVVKGVGTMIIAGKYISSITDPPDVGYVLGLSPQFGHHNPTYKVHFGGRDSRDLARVGSEKSFLVESRELMFEEWHHIAGVRDGEAVKLYIDGIPAGAAPVHRHWNLSSNQLFTIGAGQASAHGTFITNFDGFIDEVRLTIGEALSPSLFLNAKSE